ncbi:MAG: DoxX family protein [Halioglobus sp.]
MFRWQYLGLAIVFLWFMVGGITHFTSPEFFVDIMPPYIGWHLEIVYISGVLEVLGALGILLAATRQLAGNCLVVLTIAVTPANIYMWMNPELFPDVPEIFLTLRMIVQLLLLACIWWSTRQPRVENTKLHKL